MIDYLQQIVYFKLLLIKLIDGVCLFLIIHDHPIIAAGNHSHGYELEMCFNVLAEFA